MVAFASSWAVAQPQPPARAAEVSSTAPAPGTARSETLAKLAKPVAVEFKEARLEDVMRFIADASGADVDVFWRGKSDVVGLDKDATITLKLDRGTVFDLLARVLARVDAAVGGGNSWQLSESGSLQVGPKERLNKYKQVRIYTIQDLIRELPTFDNAP